jgi:predicted peptidase
MVKKTTELPGKPGIYEETLKLKNTTTLRYTLSVPESFSPQQPVPLVIALHYGGTVTPWYGKEYLSILVEPALRELGAVMAAPDCAANGWDNPSNVSAILEMLDHIKKNYNIADKQILITGFSLGGIGTWYMAARHPHIFSAAIPISSIAKTEDLDKIKDIPLYVIHSNQDEIFSIKPVQEMVQKLETRGAAIHLEIVAGISHYDTGMFVEPLRTAIPWLKKIWAI